MHIKNIHCIIEKLAECTKSQLEKGIETVDTKEMGEVADIIKDLCEAEYYAKISKIMDEHEYGEEYDENGPIDERRYYRGRSRDSMGRFTSRRGYSEPHYKMTPEMYREHEPEYWRDMDKGHGRMYYGGEHQTNASYRDQREGRSGISRRSYMETKEARPGNSAEDKQVKAKELEKYMNELSSDITEMIAGATPEEKTVLKTKMQTLLSKI